MEFKTIFYGILIVVLGIAFIGNYNELSGLTGKATDVFTIQEFNDPMPLSKDQSRLVEQLGYPNTFVVGMESGSRTEVWTYFEFKKNFIFVNGIFQKITEQKGLEGNFDFPKFRPTQFKNGMSDAELKKMLGKSSASAKIKPELMENAEVYDYFNQVKVATVGGYVAYVQTLPVPIGNQI